MRCFLLALALLLLPPCVSFAADAPADPLQAVKEVEEYLGGITTLRARFIQTANDGQQQAGTFYLSRPGRMRIDYDAPSKDFIVADGVLIYYYDGKMKQQSSTAISHSLADFFLRKNLALSGDISVSDIKQENNTLQLTLVQARDPLAGALTLMLSEKPMQLLAWRVVDAQGLVTEVRLTEIEAGNPLNKNLFHYYDPARRAPAYNGHE